MLFLGSTIRKLFFLLLLFFGLNGFAQVVDGNDNSPYTQIGIGDLAPIGFSRNLGMANTGVSMSSKYYINNLNPALLSDIKLTLFEFGLQFRIRNLTSESSSQRSFGGSFEYVSLAFPISKKMAISAGFKPFSNIRYSTSSVSKIQGDTLNYAIANNAQGSISQVFLASGYEISPNWSVGVSAGFLFGKIAEESSINSGIPVLSGYSFSNTKVVTFKNTIINGYNLQGGLLYRRQVIAESIRLNVGFTGSYAATFNSNTSVYLQKRTVNSNSDNTILRDTLPGYNNPISLPSTFTLGTSLNKGDEWSFGTDFTIQTFTNQTFRNNGSLQNAFNWSIGGEFNPVYLKRKSYFTRMVYRAGAYAGRTQYVINGKPISDAGITLGVGVPLGKLFSYLNINCQIGSRGTLDGGLIREDYYKFSLGLNINDRWFLRPKVD